MTANPVRALPRRAILLLLLAAPALFLFWLDLTRLAPPEAWLRIIRAPDRNAMAELLLRDALLPRALIAMLCGAALSLAGVLFQQILRNPLAEPATLGVSSGAYLAIASATFYAPTLLATSREVVAFAGAATAGTLVFLLGWSRTLSPVRLVLAGLVVNITCGAVATALALFNDQSVAGLYLWASGNLSQSGWDGTAYLLPRFFAAILATALLLRPLTLLGLDEGITAALGLSPGLARLAGLVVAIALTAFVVSAVGNIGFVGLAAPAVTRLAGARRLRDQFVWAPPVGAALLWLADELASRIGIGAQQLPAGTATALIGVPLLLLLLPRLSHSGELPRDGAGRNARASRPLVILATLLCLCLLVFCVAISFAPGVRGWQWASGAQLHALLPWRWPRVAGALSAGAMLAGAGCLIQRLTGNPLASPEVLGIGAGGMLAMIGALLLDLPLDPLFQTGALFAGAVATFLLLLLLSNRSSMSAARMLLAGIAINTAFAVVVALLVGSGDPRGLVLLRLISGSMSLVRETIAAAMLVATPVLFVSLLALARWLALLPLGMPTAKAVGVSPVSRLLVLCAAALLTACGTLIAGPMSFVGLMAPHMASMLGLTRPVQHLAGAMLMGAGLLMAADWLGRVALFPNELPAGIVVTLLGSPYFLWLLRRQGV